MFAFGNMSPEDVERYQKEQRDRHNAEVDKFNSELHEFFNSLTQQQGATLYQLLAHCAHSKRSVPHHYLGQLGAYLRINHDFCAPTQAPAGEMMGLAGLADLEAFANQDKEDDADDDA